MVAGDMTEERFVRWVAGALNATLVAVLIGAMVSLGPAQLGVVGLTAMAWITLIAVIMFVALWRMSA
jgi:hypothetical protein